MPPSARRTSGAGVRGVSGPAPVRPFAGTMPEKASLDVEPASSFREQARPPATSFWRSDQARY